MYRQYLKQAMAVLGESPFFSLITVLGTASAICLIMVMVIVFELQDKGVEPDVDRGRTLYVKQMVVNQKEGGEALCYTSISGPVAKNCFFTLKIPEAVSVQQRRTQALVTTTDQAKRMKSDLLRTDAAFWKVFSFHYLAGKPYEQSDVESGLPRAVISDRLALQLFGEADEGIVGQTVLVARQPYVVSGIVEDVSPLATHAYSQIWIPYPQSDVDQLVDEVSLDGLFGSFVVTIKARSSADFEAIKNELNQELKRFNSNLNTCEVDLQGQPDTQIESRLRIYSDVNPDLSVMVWQYALVLAILLLVPAMNLSGLTTSRMQKRIGELGVRKAFGATKGTLMYQVMIENFAITLLGGVLGLLFSYVAVFLLRDWLLGSSELSTVGGNLTISVGMLIRPSIFFLALLFCLLLNLLSCAIPAWQATSRNIVDSLNEK